MATTTFATNDDGLFEDTQPLQVDDADEADEGVQSAPVRVGFRQKHTDRGTLLIVASTNDLFTALNGSLGFLSSKPEEKFGPIVPWAQSVLEKKKVSALRDKLKDIFDWSLASRHTAFTGPDNKWAEFKTNADGDNYVWINFLFGKNFVPKKVFEANTLLLVDANPFQILDQLVYRINGLVRYVYGFAKEVKTVGTDGRKKTKKVVVPGNVLSAEDTQCEDDVRKILDGLTTLYDEVTPLVDEQQKLYAAYKATWDTAPSGEQTARAPRTPQVPKQVVQKKKSTAPVQSAPKQSAPKQSAPKKEKKPEVQTPADFPAIGVASPATVASALVDPNAPASWSSIAKKNLAPKVEAVVQAEASASAPAPVAQTPKKTKAKKQAEPVTPVADAEAEGEWKVVASKTKPNKKQRRLLLLSPRLPRLSRLLRLRLRPRLLPLQSSRPPPLRLQAPLPFRPSSRLG